MNPKKGFTLIEVMIVVAVIAILSMIAVSQYMLYIERARGSAARALLQNLALAETILKVDQDVNDFIPVIDSTQIANIKVLADFGFRPDPAVGFAAVPFAGEPDGNFVLFAAYKSVNSKIHVYNFSPWAGVRPFDPAASYAAILPSELTVYLWQDGSATELSTLQVDSTTGLVTGILP